MRPMTEPPSFAGTASDVPTNVSEVSRFELSLFCHYKNFMKLEPAFILDHGAEDNLICVPGPQSLIWLQNKLYIVPLR